MHVLPTPLWNHATFGLYEKDVRGHSRLVATLGDDDRLCGTIVSLTGKEP